MIKVGENPSVYIGNRPEYKKNACFLVKCVIVVGIIDAMAKHVLGIDGIAVGAMLVAISFAASVIVDNVLNQLWANTIDADLSLYSSKE